MSKNPDKKSTSKTPEKKVTGARPMAKSMSLRPAASKVVTLKHLDAPPKIVRPKRVHPRRRLPFIKEGVERGVHSTTARALIRPLDTPDQELKLFLNTELTGPAQNQTAGNVDEPSTSINGNVVFYTGNWYAAFSSDGGSTFRYLDPNNMAQPGDGDGVTFCCDQVVNYIASIDTFVWLLQYGPTTGDNIQRLAFAKTDDVVAGKWRIFDITTQALEVQGAFLDFPDLAVGSNFLYMTTNIFPQGNTAGSAVVRIPLASIASGNPTAEKFVSMDLQSFRVTQNCRDIAYFAAHKDTSTITVYSWPENQAQPVPTDVAVARWIGGTGGYFSRLPDGRRWLDRADPRITGATMAGNDLWFAWGVDANSNHRPQPFVQIARIDSTDFTKVDNINLFDSDSAICYAGLSTNAANEVGVSYMIGGAKPPTHVVGILTDPQKHIEAGPGDRGPLPDPQTGAGEWGDFLTCRPVFPDEKLFAATGYSFKGKVDGNNVDATPRFVIFGRTSNSTDTTPTDNGTDADSKVNAKKKRGGHGGSGGHKPPVGGPSGGSDDGPITDVDQLLTITPDVAAQIKAACGVNPGVRAMPAPSPAMLPMMVTKPGKERWPVKTGTDEDVALVGKNVINGRNFGKGIVEAKVEELISIPRPANMADPKSDFPAFQSKRSLPLEIVIWRLEVTITALKLEADGDYHLVLQGDSGETMIGEIPTPTQTFLGDSPWLSNIKAARQQVDDKLVHPLNPQDFVPMGNMLVPRSAAPPELQHVMASFKLPPSFVTPPEGQESTMPAFKTKVNPTLARITGVGFFDKVHGQMGVSQLQGIELHPVLKIEWL
ncbi:MAG TPA: hypothetical protein VFR24_01470 [Candidatus Angelobacter sp.]|nr:hypothetical protein [Candidatus Angelobacter sp.]